jgi:fatty-acyl-CoA synthase
MRGYHDDETMTKESFDGSWFHTGDLFRVDEEGNYYFVDRKSELIFSGGEKVFPVEVEDILCQHPQIDAAVVVGIPDRVWGEVVRAFVVLGPGVKMDAEEIIDWCTGKMATYKKPKEVIIKDALPLAEDGKILRSALKDMSSE